MSTLSDLWFDDEEDESPTVAVTQEPAPRKTVCIRVGPGRTKIVYEDQLQGDEEIVPLEPAGEAPWRGARRRHRERVVSSHLHPEERRRYEEQTGDRVGNRRDVERWMRQNGYRFGEKGDPATEHRKAMREWAKAPKDTRGPPPEAAKPRSRPLDFRKRFEQTCARKGLNPVQAAKVLLGRSPRE